ncbi:MAG: hypothetical protein NE330_03945 [Lentisphaeraceae bacterium]|nr:hypothetical protein [Lentisphaeraceae bacterium]
MKVFKLSLTALFLFVFVGFSAETPKALNSFQPLINKRTKLLNSNELKKGEGESGHGKDWLQGHATWELTDDGVFQGRKTQNDHAAGLRIHVGTLPNKTILEYKFRLDDTPSAKKGKSRMNVRFMGEGKALVFSSSLTGVVLRTLNKDGEYETIAEKKITLKKDVWYSVMLEIRDEECCLQMSSVGVLKGRHPQLKERTKKFFVYNVGESQASVKNVKFWESE